MNGAEQVVPNLDHEGRLAGNKQDIEQSLSEKRPPNAPPNKYLSDIGNIQVAGDAKKPGSQDLASKSVLDLFR